MRITILWVHDNYLLKSLLSGRVIKSIPVHTHLLIRITN